MGRKPSNRRKRPSSRLLVGFAVIGPGLPPIRFGRNHGNHVELPYHLPRVVAFIGAAYDQWNCQRERTQLQHQLLSHGRPSIYYQRLNYPALPKAHNAPHGSIDFSPSPGGSNETCTSDAPRDRNPHVTVAKSFRTAKNKYGLNEHRPSENRCSFTPWLPATH